MRGPPIPGRPEPAPNQSRASVPRDLSLPTPDASPQQAEPWICPTFRIMLTEPSTKRNLIVQIVRSQGRHVQTRHDFRSPEGFTLTPRSTGMPTPRSFSFLIPFWALSIGFLRVARD